MDQDKKIKVLFLMQFPLFGAGAGTYTRKLSEKLALQGDFEVAIAAPDIRAVPGVRVFTIKPAFRAVFSNHPEWLNAKKLAQLSGEDFSRLYLSYFKQIIKIVDEYKPDVIHVQHAAMLTWIASYIRSVYGICYIVTSHGTDVFNASLDFRFRSLTKQALERATEITVVSDDTRKWFYKIFGYNLKKKTKIITGGIDLSAYSRDLDCEYINEKYKLENKKVVIFVGRLMKDKGVEYLIKAAKNIKAEIFIIGGGDYKENLKNYAKQRSVKNVHFVGYISKDSLNEIRQFYKRANVVVIPSVWDEPLGLVVLEAMASETPVVASKRGGIPLAVKDGYNGFLVRPKSAKAIYTQVNKILCNDDLRKTLAKNARKTVEKKFDWETIILPKFLPFYHKVAEQTAKLRDKKIKALFEKETLEREKRELSRKLGAS